MPPEQRSGGITAAATVVFLGSGLTALLGVLMLLPILAPPPNIPSDVATPSPFNFHAVMIGAMGIYLAFAAWGFATGAGLLKLKAWARTSILVFSGLALFVSVCGAVGGYFAVSMIPAKPGTLSPAVVARVILAVFAVPGLIAIWWLVYFNLKRAREAFRGGYAAQEGAAGGASAGRVRPVSISVIAWLNLVGALWMPWMIWKGYPAYFFGVLAEGMAAKLILGTYLLVGVYVGIGLLKLLPSARLVTIGLSAFGLLNCLSIEFLPGRDEVLRKILAGSQTFGPNPLPAEQMLLIARLGMMTGALSAGVILLILIAKKSAFAANVELPVT